MAAPADLATTAPATRRERMGAAQAVTASMAAPDLDKVGGQRSADHRAVLCTGQGRYRRNREGEWQHNSCTDQEFSHGRGPVF